MATIEHHVNDCIGCGACAAVCPQFWKMAGAKSKLVGGKKKGTIEVLDVKSVGCNKEAADSCPVQCIKV